MSSPPKFTVVSLFAGGGGSSLGYQMAGGKCLLAVEWDAKAVVVYRANFPETTVYHGDIAALSGTEAVRLAGVQPGELDILDGSPPCQGFSTAGKRVVTDSRNQLFREFVRLIGVYRPKAFVMENVSGMVKGAMRPIFREIMRELKATGYVVKCQLLDAKWFGVPQERKRLIWIGAREDLGITPEHPKAQSRLVTVREAIGLIGQVRRPQGRLDDEKRDDKYRTTERPAPTLEKSRRLMVRESQGSEIGAVITNSSFVPTLRSPDLPAPTLTSQRLQVIERHSPRVIEAWHASKPGQSLRKARRYVGSFQSVRLDPESPSSTMIKVHRHWHYAEPRYITIGEAKALASFPPEFILTERQYPIIGNCVPPLLAKAVAEAVYEHIIAPSRERLTGAQAEREGV